MKRPAMNQNVMNFNFNQCSAQSPAPSTSSRRHTRYPSIRRALEADAWKNHPEFALQFARKLARHWARQGAGLLIVIVMNVLTPGTARAEGLSGTQPWGVDFIAPGAHQHAVALHTAIEVDITGMLARVSVRQSFRNTGGSWAEAIYRFPLPGGSAVDRLLVRSGERIIQGEIQEKHEARRQYQQARKEGRVAALVEQQRANQFETRLANIEPGAEIEVTLGFLLPIDFADGSYSLELPLTFTPRGGAPGIPEMPSVIESMADPVPEPTLATSSQVSDHRLSLSIGLRHTVNLARVESRYHEMDIRPVSGGYDLFLADPDTRTDRVFRLEWAPDFGSAPQAELLTYDAGDAVYAMLMLAPPMPEALAPQPREVVFVIDTSGSMEGQSLEQARLALVQGLDRLGENDFFNLVEFNSNSQRLYPSSVPAHLLNLIEAADFIEGLRANGGTNMSAALRDALTLPSLPGLLRQIVFITDGSVGNEDQLLRHIAAGINDSRLFTVSIGSAPNTAFMRKAAMFGRGSHTPIGKLDEVEQRMSALWQRIRNPALTDICMDWGMEADYYPELIPDLYAGEPLWLYARLPSEPRDAHLCGTIDGQPWGQTLVPSSAEGSEAIAVLWAHSRMESLEDSRLFGFDPNDIRTQVTELALQFGLLSAYTSLVAVDRTPVRPVMASLDTQSVPSLLPAGAPVTTLGASATATGWKFQLSLALGFLFVTAGLLFSVPPSLRA